MDPALRRRREDAAHRHDAALAAFPARKGAEFQRALRAVIAELEAVAGTARFAAQDPAEYARTLTWLGAAYFDLGAGVDDDCLVESASRYLQAERALTGEDAPLLKAKLAHNFANTLMGQSHGADVALLERAEQRYDAALRAFHELGEHAHARTVEASLSLLRPQLVAARELSKVRRELGTQQSARAALPTADALDRDRIQGVVSAVKARSGARLMQLVNNQAGRLETMMKQDATRFPDAAARSAVLSEQLTALKAAMEADPSRARRRETTRLSWICCGSAWKRTPRVAKCRVTAP